MSSRRLSSAPNYELFPPYNNTPSPPFPFPSSPRAHQPPTSDARSHPFAGPTAATLWRDHVRSSTSSAGDAAFIQSLDHLPISGVRSRSTLSSELLLEEIETVDDEHRVPGPHVDGAVTFHPLPAVGSRFIEIQGGGRLRVSDDRSTGPEPLGPRNRGPDSIFPNSIFQSDSYPRTLAEVPLLYPTNPQAVSESSLMDTVMDPRSSSMEAFVAYARIQDPSMSEHEIRLRLLSLVGNAMDRDIQRMGVLAGVAAEERASGVRGLEWPMQRIDGVVRRIRERERENYAASREDEGVEPRIIPAARNHDNDFYRRPRRPMNVEAQAELETMVNDVDASLAGMQHMVADNEDSLPRRVPALDSSERFNAAIGHMQDIIAHAETHFPSAHLGPHEDLTAITRLFNDLLPIRPTDLPDDAQECCICRERWLEGIEEEPVRLPACGHVFGRACIGRWIEEGRNTCPMCRDVLFGSAQEEGEEGEVLANEDEYRRDFAPFNEGVGLESLEQAFANDDEEEQEHLDYLENGPTEWDPTTFLHAIANPPHPTVLLSTHLLRQFRTFTRGFGTHRREIAEMLAIQMGRLQLLVVGRGEHVPMFWGDGGPPVRLLLDREAEGLVECGLRVLGGLERRGRDRGDV